MHHKSLAIPATLMVAALALAGCSGGNSSTANGVTHVSVWNYYDGQNADEFTALVKEFNASQSQVVVDTTTIPNANYLTKLRASATSKTLPDVSIGDLIWVPQIAQMGNAADLTKLLPASVISDLNPALKSYGSIGGKLVSVPVSANNLQYMYNKTVFTQAGLDPADPPKTWDDLMKDAKTILAKTGKPGYDLFTQAGTDGEGLTWNFQVFLWQAGGQFLNKDNSKAAFNTSAGKQALQYWVDLIKSGASPYAKWGQFEKGQGGSAQEGSWMVGIWAANPPFDFAASPLPYPTEGKQATNLGGEQAMVLTSSDAKQKAAATFLKWFLEPKQVKAWDKATGFIPQLTSVASSADYLDWVKTKQPALLPFIEGMKNAHARPNTPLYPKISLAFAQNIEKALAGQASVDDALKQAENAVNDVIKKGE